MCGIRDKGIQRRLLNDVHISMDAATEYCRTAEISERQAIIIQDYSEIEGVRTSHTEKSTNNSKPRTGARGYSTLRVIYNELHALSAIEDLGKGSPQHMV